MSILDRFTSKKGKGAKTSPKAAKVEAAEKEAFKNVPDGKKEETKATATPRKESTGDAYRVLQAPVVTEKSTLIAKSSQYVFMVAPGATKMDVRNAVQSVYGVRPIDVNMVALPGKIVRFGRTVGRQVKRKKAIVTLPAGKTIDVTSA